MLVFAVGFTFALEKPLASQPVSCHVNPIRYLPIFSVFLFAYKHTYKPHSSLIYPCPETEFIYVCFSFHKLISCVFFLIPYTLYVVKTRKREKRKNQNEKKQKKMNSSVFRAVKLTRWISSTKPKIQTENFPS